MGITPRIFRAAVYLAAIYALTLAGVVLQTATFQNTPFDEVAPTDIIVCLGGGMTRNGTLHRETRQRVATCVQLYQAGAAPRVHFTGGRADSSGPSAGGQMAVFAIELGLPSEAISTEDASHSTLQNALFSQPMLRDATSIRLVTEAFHLPRSYASFAALGPHEIYLTMSEPVRRRADGRWNWEVLAREALAIWFNAGRYLLWLGLGGIGIDGRDAILA